jgi:hypothetical protein
MLEKLYPTPTAAAKGIRVELKQAFPGIKFSVRTSYYSMGDSIHIAWDFGPKTDEVKHIVNKYQEGSFDGMTDSYTHDDQLIACTDGKLRILGGTKYVQTLRGYQTHEKLEPLGPEFIRLLNETTGELQDNPIPEESNIYIYVPKFAKLRNGIPAIVNAMESILADHTFGTEGFHGFRKSTEFHGQFDRYLIEAY